MNMSQEKDKILYEHKLTLRRIIIEKAIFLIVVIILGFIANILIERFREQQVQQRFFLEKKFDAIAALRNDYGRMIKLFSRFSFSQKKGELALPTDYKDQYLSSFENLCDTQNHLGAILSDDFTEQLLYHSWIHLGIHFNDVAKGAKYRIFVYDLTDDFDVLSKKELGQILPVSTTKFIFSKWTTEEIDSRGAPAFLKENFEKWEHQKKQQQPQTP